MKFHLMFLVGLLAAQTASGGGKQRHTMATTIRRMAPATGR